MLKIKRMLCALLCLILAGSVLPASAQAAIPDDAFQITVIYPEGSDVWISAGNSGSEYYARPGETVKISLRLESALFQLDYWETEGLTLHEAQRDDWFLEFCMPEGPVTLRAVIKEADCPYTDVSRDDWFCEAVLNVSSRYLMVGTSDTTFSPHESATRAQAAATLLGCCGGAGMGELEKLPFTDVSEDDWFYDSVYWACSSGTAAGVSDTEFAPYGVVTRAQFVTMYYKTACLLGFAYEDPLSVNFTDVPANAYYREALGWALGNGVITGKTADTFGPNDPCTRAEMAVMLLHF